MFSVSVSMKNALNKMVASEIVLQTVFPIAFPKWNGLYSVSDRAEVFPPQSSVSNSFNNAIVSPPQTCDTDDSGSVRGNGTSRFRGLRTTMWLPRPSGDLHDRRDDTSAINNSHRPWSLLSLTFGPNLK